MRPPDWQSCLRSAVVGVRTAINISAVAGVQANVACLDALVTSAVAIDSAVVDDNASVGVHGP